MGWEEKIGKEIKDIEDDDSLSQKEKEARIRDIVFDIPIGPKRIEEKKEQTKKGYQP